VVDDAAHIGFAADAHQTRRHRWQTEAVVVAQAGAPFDVRDTRRWGHARILLDIAFSPLNQRPAMPSFDAVIEPNLVELRNAVDQANKEIGTRFDFKGSSAQVEYTERSSKDRELVLFADSDFQIDQVRDLLLGRLTKRGVDIRFLDLSGKSQKIGGDKLKLAVPVKSGVDAESAKKMQAALKASKLKVQGAFQGDALRVTGAKRDELQAAMALIKHELPDLPVSFDNMRA
jgi:uncharacterized protein YajQ (UPF0234 family)